LGEFEGAQVVDGIFGKERVLDLGEAYPMCRERQEADDQGREEVLEILVASFPCQF
jgi:hypothetical protein